MFAALGRFISRHPWYVIATWIVLAVVVVATAPALTSTTDESEFLPDHYESIKAAELQEKAFPNATTPAAILVFEREDGEKLIEADVKDVLAISKELGPELGKDTFVPQVTATGTDGKPSVYEDEIGRAHV